MALTSSVRNSSIRVPLLMWNCGHRDYPVAIFPEHDRSADRCQQQSAAFCVQVAQCTNVCKHGNIVGTCENIGRLKSFAFRKAGKVAGDDCRKKRSDEEKLVIVRPDSVIVDSSCGSPSTPTF